MTNSPIITLTTDFGVRDWYVAAMKGVILRLAPEAQLVDVSHEVPPQSVAGAAYLLESLCDTFPAETIHLAVVDPGVGTERLAIAVATPHGTFVGPDNGIFTPFLDSAYTAVELANPRYQRSPVSRTFHGRDIFAPAAGHLAAGIPLLEFGPRVEAPQLLRELLPTAEGGTVQGTIRHIDHFGNAISNILEGEIARDADIMVAGTTIHGVAAHYQERRVAALIGSSGYLEIAIGNGSAAQTLGIRTGDKVVVRMRG
ncbi:MAG: SAM hydrolase/SAM-dependent halogenase family protein [Chloroflexota bacterium]